MSSTLLAYFNNQKGYLDVLVKSSYEDAVASQLLDTPEGFFVSLKGPFAYECFQYRANMRDTIHMIAGGSGISVMLQVRRDCYAHFSISGLCRMHVACCVFHDDAKISL